MKNEFNFSINKIGGHLTDLTKLSQVYTGRKNIDRNYFDHLF
jgi:hypothetical protein